MIGTPPETVEVGDLRVAFRRTGHGPPLLLLHGGVSDGRVFRRQLTDLSDEFDVVAWDAPGCGLSSDPAETFGLSDYADCAAGLVDALGLEPAHVLGHSFGGGLALELYGRHPTTARSLVLVGAYAGWAGSLPADEVARRLRLALELADSPPSETARRFPGRLSETMPTDTAEELTRIMAEVRGVGTRVMARAFAEADLRHVLPHVAIPTLLIYGDADQRASLAIAHQLHDGIPQSKLVVMPGLGHESYLEEPERFNAEVRSFLRSVTSS